MCPDGLLRRVSSRSGYSVWTGIRMNWSSLQEVGPGLGRPLVGTVAGSRHRNMKELRPGSRGRSELRVLFAFDPDRRAILLVAGDKRGEWQKWYQQNIPLADRCFDAHLRNLKRR